MFFAEEDLHLLNDIGFTKTQAKMYLTLLKLGQADGSSLAKAAEVPRQIVYRTLDELHMMGLIQKEIERPYKFTATPIKHGLQILMSQRRQQYKELQKKTKTFLQKMQNCNKIPSNEQKYNFTVIKGRERLIQIFKLNHKKAKHRIDSLSTLPRLLQIMHYCYQEIIVALDKKVQFRVVIQKPNFDFCFSEEAKSLVENPNFALKLRVASFQTNSAIFDNKEVTISYFPSKPLGASPILLTNHPSFISMARDHFKAIWKTAEKY